jgi:hypothetical protein
MANEFKLEEAILFLVFNRPETTARVFEAIREAKPPRLYVAADGPRPERPGEAERCAEVRAIASRVDWPCEVKTLFREGNLGCRAAVSSAITWFFQNEPEGIVLEDDCLPCLEFFRFCQELLERYRDDERVMHISGANFQGGLRRGDGSYYFSRIAHVWGWASWRRAWSHYDADMKSFPAFKASGAISGAFGSREQAATFLKIFDGVYSRKPWFDTWDHQWTYALLTEGGLSAIPNANLVSNIGFESGGAHTASGSVEAYGNLPFGKLDGKLEAPRLHVADEEAEELVFRLFFEESFFRRIARKIKGALR